MDGVVKNMDCPTNAIWDRRYLCIVPQMATITELEVATYGLRVTGQAHRDMEMYDMDTNVGLSINDMLGMRAQQYPVRVIDRTEAKDIYNAIHAYLAKFTERIEQKDRSMIHTTLPYDDLEELDKFADELYDMIYAEIVQKEWTPSASPFDSQLDLRSPEERNSYLIDDKHRTEKRNTFINYFEERYNNA